LLPGRYSLGFGIIGDRGYDDGVSSDAVQFEIIPSPEAVKIDAHHFGGAMVASARVTRLDQDCIRETAEKGRGATQDSCYVEPNGVV
jgi:hypothetical protein